MASPDYSNATWLCLLLNICLLKSCTSLFHTYNMYKPDLRYVYVYVQGIYRKSLLLYCSKYLPFEVSTMYICTKYPLFL